MYIAMLPNVYILQPNVHWVHPLCYRDNTHVHWVTLGIYIVLHWQYRYTFGNIGYIHCSTLYLIYIGYIHCTALGIYIVLHWTQYTLGIYIVLHRVYTLEYIGPHIHRIYTLYCIDYIHCTPLNPIYIGYMHCVTFTMQIYIR